MISSGTIANGNLGGGCLEAKLKGRIPENPTKQSGSGATDTKAGILNGAYFLCNGRRIFDASPFTLNPNASEGAVPEVNSIGDFRSW